MAYHELIKNFNMIREYMRSFYVYGFRSREEYDKKSARREQNWQLILADGSTPLRHKPSVPLTELQLRWLKPSLRISSVIVSPSAMTGMMKRKCWFVLPHPTDLSG